jgi:murein DD-endopeptidase MepM/ murein hydrolase activator NlpD
MSDKLEDSQTGKSSPQNSPSNNIDKEETSKIKKLWETIEHRGAANHISRISTHILTLVVIVVAAVVLGNLLFNNRQTSEPVEEAEGINTLGDTGADRNSSPDTITQGVILPAFPITGAGGYTGISRLVEPETIIPSRPRVDVITYVVKQGDNLFSIAEQFGLKPETILWGNYDTLKDNFRIIYPDQELNILPIDGVYYRYNVGESLSMVASQFEITTDAILEYPGNRLDPYDTNAENPGIADGTWLIIPGGKRELQDWGPPPISRDNPASAQYYGPGHCGEIYQGEVGTGTFIWPTPATYLSGYDYTPGIHEAIDIGGQEGNAIFATDSGVVVYAGWSNYGYGNLIVLDHGNGWQSAYAHLSGIAVYCGQSVYQGTVIGYLGNTGNSTGAHLHFELRYGNYRVNPLDWISP